MNVNCDIISDRNCLTATEIYFAFHGRLVSLLVLRTCGGSPMPLLPQESPYISFAKMVKSYHNYFLLDEIVQMPFRGGCLERRNVDFGGNSTCLKPPQEAVFASEEADRRARGKHRSVAGNNLADTSKFMDH